MLFDRDGTLIKNVPYLADPRRVRPMPGARRTLDQLRRQGVAVGVVSNQSGVGRGLINSDELAKVNARVESLLGPFDTWQICPHAPMRAAGVVSLSQAWWPRPLASWESLRMSA